MSPVPAPGTGKRHCHEHCPTCHHHFTSLAAFDLHRAGTHQRGRRCIAPGDVVRKGAHPLTIVEHDGSCEMYPTTPEYNVEIWGVGAAE